MNTLEREVIEKFHQLDSDAQKRVRELIVNETESADQTGTSLTFNYETWFREIEALQQDIRSHHGNSLPPTDVVGILRDIRDGEDE